MLNKKIFSFIYLFIFIILVGCKDSEKKNLAIPSCFIDKRIKKSNNDMIFA
jgi:hypothetical protein